MVLLVITEELKPFEKAIYNESDQVLTAFAFVRQAMFSWLGNNMLNSCIAPSRHSYSTCLPCCSGHNMFCSNLSCPSTSEMPIVTVSFNTDAIYCLCMTLM